MPSEGHLVGELEEELGNVNPLFGVNDTPKVPLEAAVAASGVGGLDGAVFGARMFAQQNADKKLDEDEVAAIYLYT